MAAIRSLVVKVGADVSELNRKMDQGQQSILGFAQKAKSALMGLAAVKVGFEAGKMLFDFAKQAENYAIEISQAAEKTGFAVTELQELRYVARQLNFEFKIIPNAIAQMSQRMKSLDQDSSDVNKAFTTLGIELTDLKGNIRPVSDLFEESVLKLSYLKDETQRNIVASLLFGRSYQELIPLIAAGSSEITKYRVEANKLGLVNEDIVGKGLLFNETMDRSRAVFENLKLELGTGVIPVLIKVGELLTPLAKGFSDLMQPLDKNEIYLPLELTTLESLLAKEKERLKIVKAQKDEAEKLTGFKGWMHGIIYATKDDEEAIKKKIKDLEKDIENTKAKMNIKVDIDIEEPKEELTDIDDWIEEFEKRFKKIMETDAAKKLANTLETTAKSFVSSLKSQMDAFMNFTGLFDRVTRENLSPQRLMNRLKGQLKVLDEWKNSLSDIGKRIGTSSELYKQLVSMGPGAAGGVSAISRMTDEQLKEYQALYGQRPGMVSGIAEQATFSQFREERAMNQIVMNVSGNTISDGVDIDDIGRRIVQQLRLAGVLP